jgi:hypothetical protein
MDTDNVAPPHSKQEISDQIIKMFPEMDLGVPSGGGKGLPLFRMLGTAHESVVLRVGWRYLAVFSRGESFIVDALSSTDPGFKFSFRRGVGRVWLRALRNLVRRQEVRAGRFEVRCLDVPPTHQSFIWLYSATSNILVKIHELGQVCQREKFRDLQEVQGETQVALDRNIARFEQMRRNSRTQPGKP